MPFRFSQKNTFCINLKRRTDRWERMQAIFNELGLSVTQWVASEPPDVKDNILGTPTQRACAQSHIRIWKHMLENNIHYALILEDDLSFDRKWLEKLNEFDKKFDLLMLNADHFYDINNWSNTKSNTFLTGGYILTHYCAETMINLFYEKIGKYLAADHMLVNFQRYTKNAHCYSYFPYLIIQSSLDSDIDGSMPEFSYIKTITELNALNYPLSNYVGLANVSKPVDPDVLKLYVSSFWNGFIDKTDPVHIDFFISLFEKLFDRKIELGSFDESHILLESFFGSHPMVQLKKWRYSFFYSGESESRYPIPKSAQKDYTFILRSKSSMNNIINLPEFIPYVYSNNFVESLENPKRIQTVPSKGVCAIISNGTSKERNLFLDKLEKKIDVEYLGPYRNNAPLMEESYNTPEFSRKLSEYKFIISLENSRDDTYVTEKIIHAMIAGIIPLYWGSEKVTDYFNEDRFIHLKELSEKDMDEAIDRMIFLSENPDEYLKIVNSDILKDGKMQVTIDSVVEELKKNMAQKEKMSSDMKKMIEKGLDYLS